MTGLRVHDHLTAHSRVQRAVERERARGSEHARDRLALRRRAPTRCPYCKSVNTTIRSEFGSTACKAILFCNSCSQPFELFKTI